MRTPIKARLIRFLKMAEHGLAVVGLCMIVYYSLFDVSVVVSNSMAPTIQGTSRENGDWILTEKITYLFRNPRRWELVAYRGDFNVQVMKRVVGLPNERISIRDLKPVINDNPVEVPESLNFIKYYSFGNLYGRKAEFACFDGYYVLGDNSRDSDDSRFNGTLPSSSITGRPLLRIWPVSRIGFVNL